MNSINILITGGGSPGISGTIYSLKNNYDNRDLKIITTDAKSDFIGKYVSDKFYQISKANDAHKYLEDLLEICSNEKVDVILPQNTAELKILALNKSKFAKIGTNLIVSSPDSIQKSNNKYELLKICEKIKIPFPKYFLVNKEITLREKAIELGWPDVPVVIKHPSLNGSRGIRIIDENKNYKSLFYNEKPTNMYTKLNDFLNVVGSDFENLLLMEFLPGDEISLDLFRDSNNFISIPRIRDEIRSGISFKNSSFHNNELIQYSKKLSEELNLKFCYGFQFKFDINGVPRILECNPRVQGTMVFSTFMGANVIYSSIKSCLGEKIPKFKLNWNTKLFRYWGAIGTGKKIIKI